ncbi:hypothetical protein NEPAR06_2406 [Nematocida parisii]|uniref:Uncharacterized protein n=1 Tax=Nematocida parisii (strain ERTm3) TaxID=935791 RepID=I3EJY3_NEMP3|nr:hypothetical protein NEQG_00300 [Nematocida parisii ERTm3]KAI5145938.1 hypothetical protein NEPAR07_1968 [Nematocida parisii]KAI5157201.1 hypothetical protein NEPAR06_2406 [Nematocida parisii]KAI5157849.1 hypothetical protein NEPAR05_1640 [Nematocida parisii]
MHKTSRKNQFIQIGITVTAVIIVIWIYHIIRNNDKPAKGGQSNKPKLLELPAPPEPPELPKPIEKKPIIEEA